MSTLSLNRILNEIDNLYANAPKEPFHSATKSALYTGLVVTVFTLGNLPAGLLGVAFGGLSSLIYSAVTPIFAELSKGGAMSREMHLCRIAVSIIPAGLLTLGIVPIISLIVNVIFAITDPKQVRLSQEPLFVGGVFERWNSL